MAMAAVRFCADHNRKGKDRLREDVAVVRYYHKNPPGSQVTGGLEILEPCQKQSQTHLQESPMILRVYVKYT